MERDRDAQKCISWFLGIGVDEQWIMSLQFPWSFAPSILAIENACSVDSKINWSIRRMHLYCWHSAKILRTVKVRVVKYDWSRNTNHLSLSPVVPSSMMLLFCVMPSPSLTFPSSSTLHEKYRHPSIDLSSISLFSKTTAFSDLLLVQVSKYWKGTLCKDSKGKYGQHCTPEEIFFFQYLLCSEKNGIAKMIQLWRVGSFSPPTMQLRIPKHTVGSPGCSLFWGMVYGVGRVGAGVWLSLNSYASYSSPPHPHNKPPCSSVCSCFRKHSHAFPLPLFSRFRFSAPRASAHNQLIIAVPEAITFLYYCPPDLARPESRSRQKTISGVERKPWQIMYTTPHTRAKRKRDDGQVSKAKTRGLPRVRELVYGRWPICIPWPPIELANRGGMF